MGEEPDIVALVERTKAGDRASYGQLVALYARRLYVMVRRHTGSHADAEDIVQETFLRAYQHLDKYDSRYKFGTWLLVIGVRQARSWYRRKRPMLAGEALEAVAARDCPADQDEASEEIWETARRLPGHFYEVLWLKYQQDMSIEDIAKALGKTQVNVKVMLHRARKAMQELLWRQLKEFEKAKAK